MTTTIPRRIIDAMTPATHERTIADVRIGLKYTSVRLDNGHCGVSWTGPDEAGCCMQNPEAKPLAGRHAQELLGMLENSSPLQRTLGLATANALAAGMPDSQATSADALDLVGIQETDHVVMVGLFGPLMPVLRRTNCRLDVLELHARPGTISPQDGQAALKACTVAIITSTSIVTGTMDDLLSRLGAPRATILLGPSTCMRPEVYTGTPVTHLAGARIRNASGVERIVSEGGGTKILKHHMDFETIRLS